MANLNWEMLPWQIKVWNSKARFKVLACGRRVGKSNLAIKMTLAKALEAPEGSAVVYVAPTLAQARQIAWQALLDEGAQFVKSSHLNNLDITLVTGRKIHIRSAENPDTLRGLKLYFAVLDEAAFTKDESLWTKVIRPALSDLQGEAVFVSSPEGRNWFWELFKYAQESNDPEWEAFHFTTYDNPTIPPKEIEAAKKTLSTLVFNQEFLASFATAGQQIFKEEWIKHGKRPQYGSYFIAIDLAGFEQVTKNAGAIKKKLDETAIAIVKVSDEDGTWFVEDVKHGRWDIKQTAQEIFKVVDEFNPIVVGIEKGALKNAVMPYISDMMRRYNKFFHIVDLTHQNQKKTDRITGSLQGFMEHGRIILNEDADNRELEEQLILFPTPGIHDDLVDALAYIAQIATSNHTLDLDADAEIEIIDAYAGY
jgi:phage terminase large subunit-like protein